MWAGELVPCAWVRYGLLGAIHPLGIMGCVPISHPSLTSNHVSQLGERAVSMVPSTGGKQSKVRSTSNAIIQPITEFQLIVLYCILAMCYTL